MSRKPAINFMSSKDTCEERVIQLKSGKQKLWLVMIQTGLLKIVTSTTRKQSATKFIFVTFNYFTVICKYWILKKKNKTGIQ